MIQPVILTVRGTQRYPEQAPEVIELVTEGILEDTPNGWVISYEESDLTGLSGTKTAFVVEPDSITLTRKGQLNSEMVFREGIPHDSLYQMAFGTMMITVCAKQVQSEITHAGGTVDLTYSIEIENTAAGTIEYHLDIQYK